MGLLGQDTNDGQPLLYHKWVKANKNKADMTQLVTEIKLSRNEEWILILTSESIAMMSAKSNIGKELWSNLQEFGGIGKALIIYPEKGKLGFDLDFHETKKVVYSWEDEVLSIDTNLKRKKSSGLNINWKNALISNQDSVVEQSSDTLNFVEAEPMDYSSSTKDTKLTKTRESKKKTLDPSGTDTKQNATNTQSHSTPPSVSSTHLSQAGIPPSSPMEGAPTLE